MGKQFRKTKNVQPARSIETPAKWCEIYYKKYFLNACIRRPTKGNIFMCPNEYNLFFSIIENASVPLDPYDSNE